MRLTYNEILDSMKTAFCKEKGEPVKNLSDLETRFKAVASEIYAVSVYGDFIMKQSFPQTAVGAYLDRHAALRKIKRKSPAFAAGSITVSRTENSLGTAVTIPAGTVFSVSEKPFIQFSTTNAVSIAADVLSAAVQVSALKTGSEYNISAGAKLIAVNPPAHLESAVSKTKFSGGCDEESDEALRERILGSYKSRRNAVSAAAVREMLLTLDNVSDAVVSGGENHTVKVCLKTDSGAINDNLKKQVTDMMGFAVLCGAALEFTAAKEQPFSVTAEAKILSGYDSDAIKQEVKARITEFCSSEKIGKNYSESAISAYCSGIEGVEYIHVFLGTANAVSVACASTNFLKLNTVEVYTHE